VSSSRPWMKVYETWWTSRSHVDMTDAELGRGLRIMSLANASPDQGGDAQYCIRADGAPYSLAALARECRCSVGALVKTIDKFVAVNTMARRDDGAIGFPNFIPRQLSPSALRMRRLRERERHADGDSGVTVTPDVSVTPSARGQRTEDRGQRSQQPEGGGSEISVARVREAPPPIRTRESIAEQRAADIERLRERLTLTGEVPKPVANGQQLQNLPVSPGDMAKVLDTGDSPDEVVTHASWLSGEITAGRCKRDAWSNAFFGGFYASFRLHVIPEKFDARAGPKRGPVDPRTQRHDTPPEF
jgi:hypothetical protein